jgi:tetratricopeptide (TPR) repeat protein
MIGTGCEYFSRNPNRKIEARPVNPSVCPSVMPKLSHRENSSAAESRRNIFLAGGLIVFAALAGYAGSSPHPFVLDDVPAIMDNPTIRQLRSIGTVLSPPHADGITVGGRPLLNLSLALNYAAGGTAVRGYHALNLAIHALAGLTLFGVVRRTLRLGSIFAVSPAPRSALSSVEGRTIRARFGASALPLALAVGLLWTIHPLQTESVTYIVQRAESLMGLFYLLTLYCFIRSTDSPTPIRWYALAVTACLLGMTTKEVMVSAPVIVMLYDRTFVAGTFREAWRQRGKFYAGLACTWVVLGWLVVGAGTRGGSAGFGSGIHWWVYALTQFHAVAHYLQLSLWPHPLVLDYGAERVSHAAQVVPYALLVAPLLAGTVIGLWRWPAAGFIGAWFFAILAPTSSVVPVADTMFEHRMYLPLAAVVAVAVLGLYALAGRRGRFLCLGLGAGLGALTVQRNQDYRSSLALWTDTVAKSPGNPRAHYNLGVALGEAGRTAEAIGHYAVAVQIKPDFAEAHNNLGNALLQLGRLPEAVRHCEEGLRLKPQDPVAHYNLGRVLAQIGRSPEALQHYAMAVQLKPDFADAHNNLGNALAQIGRLPEAIRHYEVAVRLNPDLADAHNNLGNALAQLGRLSEAIRHYEVAVRLNPEFAEAHYNLGHALAQAGRLPEAIRHYEAAVRLQPDSADAHNNLGNAFSRMGRPADAVGQYEAALHLNPGYGIAHRNLGNALCQIGRVADAMAEYEQALRINPDDADSRKSLARLRALPQSSRPGN